MLSESAGEEGGRVQSKGFAGKCCTWISLRLSHLWPYQVPFEHFLLDNKGLDRHCMGYADG